MPLVPFKLLPQCWSPEGVSLSKCMCGASPFKKRGLRIPQVLQSTQPPLIFTARSYGDLSFWHWNPGLVDLVSGWDPLPTRYPSILYPPHMGLGPAGSRSPCLHLCPSFPPTHLGECGFFNSLVVGLPYSSVF